METWEVVDLRSDTLTLPSEEMRKAMSSCPLGDDSYDGDPTTVELENMAASIMGKESGLLVISGTMGNLISILAHTRPCDEIILEAFSHSYLHEVGGFAALGGLMCHQIVTDMGVLRPDDVKNAIRPRNRFSPRTSLICIENTHNHHGGTVITPVQLSSLSDVARESDIPIHMDGSRVFNAAVALGCDVRELTKYSDSVMFCLSKGLSAPLGSMVVGNREFIERARYFRQMVGGGMRQSGVFAAAGVVALRTMVNRLVDDHENAKRLAHGLADIGGIRIDLDRVQTNIVLMDISSIGATDEQILKGMAERGVRAFAIHPTMIRLVTYRGISEHDMDLAVKAIADCVYQFKTK